MSCKYKDECPSYTGWCEREKQKYEDCLPFLITAYENEKKRANKLEEALRRKDVRGEGE